MTTLLQPIFDTRKSFYGKATIEQNAEGMNLYSYNTLVCTMTNAGRVFLGTMWDSSATTLRHVKEFLKQNGYTADSKKQIAATYMK